ncbi:WhiB family transcriptional regulator [Rhodococcus sp. MALMAid1271]|uniref:WhiB family transcriptional regulator n=1 Tax=Rhodococcus sp. MALMAid1271 TaxID=3411744 RepID=UPI0030FA93E2
MPANATLSPTLEAWRWQLKAQCRTMPISMFYPDAECQWTNLASAESAAKAVCVQCPVRADCLAHAMTYGEPDGIWGGLTHRERRRRTRNA